MAKQYIPTNEGVVSATYFLKPGWYAPTYEVMIAGRDYEGVAYAAQNMWSSKKSGQYGQGLINTDSDPQKCERVGKLGEMAMAKLYGLPFDYTYREGGDQYDFEINGVTVDIKTSAQKPIDQKHNYALITASRNGYQLPLKCDIYVAAYVDYDDVARQEAKVVVIGWQTADVIRIYPQIVGKGGQHHNYTMPYGCLSPMTEFEKQVQLIASKRKDEQNGKAA